MIENLKIVKCKNYFEIELFKRNSQQKRKHVKSWTTRFIELSINISIHSSLHHLKYAYHIKYMIIFLSKYSLPHQIHSSNFLLLSSNNHHTSITFSFLFFFLTSIAFYSCIQLYEIQLPPFIIQSIHTYSHIFFLFSFLRIEFWKGTRSLCVWM